MNMYMRKSNNKEIYIQLFKIDTNDSASILYKITIQQIHIITSGSSSTTSSSTTSALYSSNRSRMGFGSMLPLTNGC